MSEQHNHTQPVQASQPLWAFIPATEYSLPPPPITQRVKGGLSGLWQKMRPVEKKPESPLTEADVLETLPNRLKSAIAPAPDWRTAALILAEILTPGASGVTHETLALVTPPHGGAGAILKLFSGFSGWRVINPPTAEQILAGDENWLKSLTDNPAPWVLPDLEKCYLRHHRGLTLVRRFFLLLQQGQVPTGIIGCDSWAWAYFQRIMPELLPSPITTQAFEYVHLAQWFRDLAPCFQDQPIRFRQSDNGNDVLPLASNTTTNSESAFASSQFLKYLAAYSRGIPGIAWSIWSSALRSLPDDENVSIQSTDASMDLHSTIWVNPWNQLKLPTPPASMKPEQLLLLHSLLLHNGLTIAQLPMVLPFTVAECSQAVSLLKKYALVEQDLNAWRVSAAAYPSVWQLLKTQGYLTDGF